MADEFSDRKQRMYHFLRENPTGVLSMVTPDGNPHGVVIYFTVNPDLTISFMTKSMTRKYDNLIHNPRIHLTVFNPEIQGTLQVSGKVREITDKRRVNVIAGRIWGDTLQLSEAGVPPIVKLDAGDFAGFDILPYQMRMAVYARPDSGTYNDLFESIESFDWENADTR
jgi:general stress protein 26